MLIFRKVIISKELSYMGQSTVLGVCVWGWSEKVFVAKTLRTRFSSDPNLRMLISRKVIVSKELQN